MPYCPSEPVVPPTARGRITRISVTYTVNTDAGTRHTFHSLEAMRHHARPERVDELVEDLTLICEDLTSPPTPASHQAPPQTWSGFRSAVLRGRAGEGAAFFMLSRLV